MPIHADKSARDSGGRKSPRASDGGATASSKVDYRDASGRDHPAESEHDHAAQSEPDHARHKLKGESAKMAKEASEGAGADEVVKPRKA